MAKRHSLNIKGLLLAHAEKLVVAIVACCFVMLIWYSLTRKGIRAGMEPADIVKAAADAKITISRTTWEDFNSKPYKRNFAQESGWYELPRPPYKLSFQWDPPLWPKQGLREDPAYLAIRELESHYDQGALALITGETLQHRFRDEVIPVEVQQQIDAARPKPDKPKPVEADANNLVAQGNAPVKVKFPGGPVEENEVTEGRRWIMVTGLVPVQEQIDLYDKYFRDAAGFDQKNDFPLYFGYEVERADVTGGANPEWKKIAQVYSRTMLIDMLRWSRVRKAEIIDNRYVHEVFTYPLPPRILELWSERDKHSKVPLVSSGERKQEAAKLIGDDPLGDLGGGAVEDVDTLMSGARKKPGAEDPASQQIPYKMLRYVDFNILPGHAYQYRFRIALRDPNYVRLPEDRGDALRRVEIKLLDAAVVERINKKRQALEKQGLAPELVERMMQITYTPWSEASPAVKVPPDVYVLAVGADPVPEGRYNVEPSARLMVTQFDMALGLETGAETKLFRSGLANFVAENVRLIDTDYSTFNNRNVSFSPDAMLLDIRGGESLGGKKFISPGELLLFDMKTGKLIVSGEIEDTSGVKGFHNRQEKLKALIPAAPVNPNAVPADTDIIGGD